MILWDSTSQWSFQGIQQYFEDYQKKFFKMLDAMVIDISWRWSIYLSISIFFLFLRTIEDTQQFLLYQRILLKMNSVEPQESKES